VNYLPRALGTLSFGVPWADYSQSEYSVKEIECPMSLCTFGLKAGDVIGELIVLIGVNGAF